MINIPYSSILYLSFPVCCISKSYICKQENQILTLDANFVQAQAYAHRKELTVLFGPINSQHSLESCNMCAGPCGKSRLLATWQELLQRPQTSGSRIRIRRMNK